MPWFIHLCHFTHSYIFLFVCHDSSIRTQFLTYVHAMTHSFVSFHSFIYLPICVIGLIRRLIRRLIPICRVTHSFVCHDSFIFVPWLIHLRHLTHSYVFLFATLWHLQDHFYLGGCTVTHLVVCSDPSICVPWLMHFCAMTHSFLWSDSFICFLFAMSWHLRGHF